MHLLKCLPNHQQEPAGTKQKIEAALERLENLGLGGNVNAMDNTERTTKDMDLLRLVTGALSICLFTDIMPAPSVGSRANFRWYWIVLELQIMWERRRMSRLYLISWIRFEMSS